MKPSFIVTVSLFVAVGALQNPDAIEADLRELENTLGLERRAAHPCDHLKQGVSVGRTCSLGFWSGYCTCMFQGSCDDECVDLCAFRTGECAVGNGVCFNKLRPKLCKNDDKVASMKFTRETPEMKARREEAEEKAKAKEKQREAEIQKMEDEVRQAKGKSADSKRKMEYKNAGQRAEDQRAEEAEARIRQREREAEKTRNEENPCYDPWSRACLSKERDATAQKRSNEAYAKEEETRQAAIKERRQKHLKDVAEERAEMDEYWDSVNAKINKDAQAEEDARQAKEDAKREKEMHEEHRRREDAKMEQFNEETARDKRMKEEDDYNGRKLYNERSGQKLTPVQYEAFMNDGSEDSAAWARIAPKLINEFTCEVNLAKTMRKALMQNEKDYEYEFVPKIDKHRAYLTVAADERKEQVTDERLREMKAFVDASVGTDSTMRGALKASISRRYIVVKLACEYEAIWEKPEASGEVDEMGDVWV